MHKKLINICCVFVLALFLDACAKHANSQSTKTSIDTSLINTSHLDYLYTPVTFSTGTKAAGIYIYADAPDYHLVAANGEGFTCVDDVSRAALVYMRNQKFFSDTAIQAKVFNLINFILEMQSSNGYFYNFLFPNSLINTNGATSVNNPNWWSWRALQTLTEAMPLISTRNTIMSGKMGLAINKLVSNIKTDLAYLSENTNQVQGVTVPQWLPAGSGTDQSSTLILGLIPYCVTSGDTAISAYIKKLADGIVLMQAGDAMHFPYSCFLSWENQWHAYGNDQAYALMLAGIFLNDSLYTSKGLAEVDNFYPWLLQNGFLSSFSVTENVNLFQPINELSFDQIAYGIRPMVFAAIQAYQISGQDKYADLAGHLAAWFLGANVALTNMYSLSTGRCYDGITSASNVNLNAGAESTIEALLTMERIEQFPAVKSALNKYKKQ